MQSCCPENSLGSLKIDDYQPKGQTVTLGQMRLYHVGSGSKAVLFSFDIFGYGSGRTFQICDRLASKGWQVFMPDFFLGKPYPNKPIGPDVVDVIKSFPFESALAPLLREKVLPFMKDNGAKQIALLGTCWGAWNNFKLIAMPEFEGLVKCNISVHPSLRIEEMFDKSVQEMVQKVGMPNLVLPSRNEPDRIKPKGELIQMLAKSSGCTADADITLAEKSKVDFSCGLLVCLFDKVNHGFFTRGKLTDPDYKEAVEKTCWLVEGYLKAHL